MTFRASSSRCQISRWFTKKLWRWVTLAFLALFTTSPSHTHRVAQTRVLQFLAATAVWLGFTGWFFGPALLERLIANTKHKNASPKWPKYHTYAFVATLLVLATALLAAGTTSVYFHTLLEKFSGFGACYPHFTSVPSRRVLETDVTR